MKLIKLTKGLETMVDDDDYQMLMYFKWNTNSCKGYHYACSSSKMVTGDYKTFKMHRFIMDVWDKNICVDHIDRNTLNNQRNNLRICTKAENNRNCKPRKDGLASKYKGVFKDEKTVCGRTYLYYRSSIQVDKKTISLGSYRTQIEAAIAYDIAAIKYHKEFAYLNFPNKEYFVAKDYQFKCFLK